MAAPSNHYMSFSFKYGKICIRGNKSEFISINPKFNLAKIKLGILLVYY